ncbi:DUF418 domain-containing protein [Sporosarcina highlanderae]|uniref:DUF418 domain-containing protein n=1 Tax=Sporosarcina highlanderae TaxID=3035916 RepID=A0ABT8JPF9_9BACL|nr:DUF418 domain-containing protein [Sporosarcina highlanderae]MDN4606847.1 DUF418 domain-containing protein [Sporosarcina highlanderae]
MKVSPTIGNRIDSLDMLRGFALLGILIANMLSFHSPYFYIDALTYFGTPGDEESYKLINIFIETSFYPIFAMMFGYGLNMQYEKANANGVNFAPIMARRLAILMGFGLIHALFIWSGDVLFTYAIMGFIMIAAVRIPKKWLLWIASLVYLIPSLLFIGLIYVITMFDPNQLMEGFSDIQQIERAITAYGHGTYGEAFVFRISEWILFGLTGSFMGVFMILPLIMIGSAFSKMKLFERASEWKGRIAIVAILSLALGIFIKAWPYIDNTHTYYNTLIQQLIGGPILAIGYACVIILLCQLPIFITIFRPVSKAGRMSLTTYLMQSVIATLIFYSYGFGLYGKVDLATGTLIAVGIFAIQVIFAELWLMKFRMGPFEWIWRKGIYGRNMPKKEENGKVL